MKDKQILIRLNELNLQKLKEIKNIKQVKSTSKAINKIIEETYNKMDLQTELKQIHQDLMLQRKYINSIRRDNFLILHLLNAITYQLDIVKEVNHTNPDFKSIAYINAEKDLKKYMTEITTKIAENNKNIDELGDFIDE